MANNEKLLFETFWEHVRKSEIDIRLNGHEGCPPPEWLADPWDDDFAAAYEAIRPFLRHLRKDNVFLPPPGMTWRPTPLITETAHQALMWFLNPTKQVYGHPDVLDSPEYRAIKAAAMEERQLRSVAKAEAARKPKASKDKTKDKNRILIPFLLDHHKKHGKEPLTVTEISARMTALVGGGWSQPSVSRAMLGLYKEGMSEYRRLCVSGAILKKGILKRYEDGSADVDAIVEDEQDD